MSAISEVDEEMVLVTLLTGADAETEGRDTLMVEGRVVAADEDDAEDEEDDEDGFDAEGGPAPAAVSKEVEGCCGDVGGIVEEGALAGMVMLGTGADGGSTEWTV